MTYFFYDSPRILSLEKPPPTTSTSPHSVSARKPASGADGCSFPTAGVSGRPPCLQAGGMPAIAEIRDHALLVLCDVHARFTVSLDGESTEQAGRAMLLCEAQHLRKRDA